MELLEYMIDQNNIDFIEKSDVRMIGSLIKGLSKPSQQLVEDEKSK